jgi:hypothetical protein
MRLGEGLQRVVLSHPVLTGSRLRRRVGSTASNGYRQQQRGVMLTFQNHPWTLFGRNGYRQQQRGVMLTFQNHPWPLFGRLRQGS